MLIGPPGSGKSTVGRILAGRLGRELVDTDELFERRLGVPVPDYIRHHGEPAFRRAESRAVADACRRRGAIIATGGGAVLDPLNRWALWHHGTVAWLDAAPEVLSARLASDPVARPTFQPYRPQDLAAYLAGRLPMYRAADLHLDAARSADAVADDLCDRPAPPAGRRLYEADPPRHHPVGPERARVVLGVELAEPLPPDAVAVVDRRLAAAWSDRIGSRPHLAVAGGERTKRLASVERVLDWLAGIGVERGTTLAAIGGGTVGDMAGTAAALYARGLPLAQVPTTWLAQADSAIGGKVAVDLRSAKNMAGAFWPPALIVSDVAALRSLPIARRRDGMAESVKSAIIGDPVLWDLIEERGVAALHDDEAARYAIIERSARLKLDVCERDPFEVGARRTLNLGHTIGHALEVESGYRLPHGSAVGLGMRAVAAIAAGRDGDPDLPARLEALLSDLGLPTRHAFDASVVRAAMRSDKKRVASRQRWILPVAVGRTVEVDDVSEAELSRALRSVAA